MEDYINYNDNYNGFQTIRIKLQDLLNKLLDNQETIGTLINSYVDYGVGEEAGIDKIVTERYTLKLVKDKYTQKI